MQEIQRPPADGAAGDARHRPGISAQLRGIVRRALRHGIRADAVGLVVHDHETVLCFEPRVHHALQQHLLVPGAGDEQVLLQGVVDAWFETKDGLVIVDYKTDRIRPDAVPERTAYYAAQLRAYAGAMARITGRPVCRRTLYFLHCGCSADVPETDA